MKRAQGYGVLHPMGWDTLVSAEQYALDTEGNDPAEFTRKILKPLNVKSITLGVQL